MFNWNPRRYGDVWSYELALHHFPGQPELQQGPPPIERHHRLFPPPYVQPNEPSPTDENAGQNQVLSFIRRCYLVAIVFMVVSIMQWLIFPLLVRQKGILVVPGFICLTLAFTSLLLLTFCQRLRFNKWFSWIFATLFVETIAMGVVLLLPVRSPRNILVAVVAALLLLLLCYLLGSWLPLIVLPGEITLAMILILFMAVGTVVLTMFIVTDQDKYQAIYYGLLGFVTVPMSLYHAQLVHARRHILPTEEYLSCAVSIFIHFILFFVVSYYIIWVHNW